jgi:amidophosphoribosyltransferase
LSNITIDLLKEKVHDECGVFGIYRRDDDIDVTAVSRAALYALQHRGQESAGIAVNCNGECKVIKDIGMVSEVLTDTALEDLPTNGDIAVAHVRYTPYENLDRAGTQPLVIRYIQGSLSIAYNGSITNFAKIRKELEEGGAIFQSLSNSELIAYIIASERINSETIEEAVSNATKKLQGAYSFVVSSPSKLIAVRDPNGFRPLALGKLGKSYVIASESCAFDSIDAKFIRNIRPGEMVVVDEEGLHTYENEEPVKSSLCLFEYVYIARPDSLLDCGLVHTMRKEFGKELAREFPVEADLVCGVPDSGNDAAQGYAEESGIPYGCAFIKNKYIARGLSNVKNSKKERLLKMRLNVLKNQVRGKRIVIIDDSIVHGNTSGHIVRLLREAGASEIHMRISSPPMKYSCYFGSDLNSDKDNMIANIMTVSEMKDFIGVDSLGFIDINKIREITNKSGVGVCDACFTGEYPAPVPTEDYVDKFSKKISLEK